MIKSVLFIALFAALAMAMCNNPLVPGDVTAYRANPEPYVGTLCPAEIVFPDGDSCCSADANAQIETAFLVARAAADSWVEFWRDYDTSGLRLEGNARSGLDAICGGDACSRAVDSIYESMIDFIEDFPTVARNCWGSMLRYTAGVYCWLCSPAWNTWATETTILGVRHVALRVAQSNCDRLVTDCRPVYEEIEQFWANVARAACVLVGNLLQNADVVADCENANPIGGCSDNPTLCEGLICAMVRGATPRPPMSGSSKRLMAATDDMPEQVRRALEEAARLQDQAARQSQARSVLSTEGVADDNTYAADGYDAIDVGNKSELPADSASTVVLSTMAVIVAIAAFIF